MEPWVIMSESQGAKHLTVVSAVFKSEFYLLLGMTMAVILFIVITTSDPVCSKTVSWFCVRLSAGRASFSRFRSLRKEPHLRGSVDGSGFGMSSMAV